MVCIVEEEKNEKIWRKRRDVDAKSVSMLCAVTVYVLKRQVKENSFLLREEELNVERPE